MRRVTNFVAVMAASTMVLAACSGGSGGATTTSTSASGAGSASASGGGGSGKQLKVGLAYDIGGRGDKSFNDSAAAGLDKAKTDLGIEFKELSATPNETDADKEARLKLLAQGGYNPVIGVGFLYGASMAKVAPQFPNTQFAIIDSVVEGPDKKPMANVTGLTFAEEQGSYLVGVAAALKSTTGSVGFIGGCKISLLQKFEAGFTAGAKSVNPAIKVAVKYLSDPPNCTGFNDPANGKLAAKGQYDGGADIIFAAAGGSGTGVFQAAKEANKKAIGVDSDQYQSAAPDLKSVVMTSMLKRVDVAVYEMIKSAQAGTPLTGVQSFDLKKDGVGYSTSGGQVDDIKDKLEAAKKQITDGAVKVPSTP